MVIANYIYGMVAEILENYQNDHPEHRLLICEVPDKAEEQRLLEQKTDLALITGPIFSNDLNYRILIESPDYLCLPEDHPLAQKTSIHFRDIQNEPFVTMNADFKIYDCYVNHMLELSCSPKIMFTAASLEASEEVLKRKKAIAMHNVQYHLSPEGFVKIPMKEKAQWRLQVALHKLNNSEAAKNLYQYIIDHRSEIHLPNET